MHQQPHQESVVGVDSLSLIPRAQLWDSASIHPQDMGEEKARGPE